MEIFLLIFYRDEVNSQFVNFREISLQIYSKNLLSVYRNEYVYRKNLLSVYRNDITRYFSFENMLPSLD